MHAHVKRELSFQQAICYLSFRLVNILHGLTVHSVNRLVKNPKHITAMDILNIMVLARVCMAVLHQLVKNAKIIHLYHMQMPGYLLVMQMSKH